MAVKTDDSAKRCYELIESEIIAYFERSIKAAAAISPSYEQLWKDLFALFQAGGKRLRPRMAYLSYRAFGGNDLEGFAPVAAATELLHLSMLIHDDIIDRDLVRYGVPNITGRYLEHYEQLLQDRGDRLHFAQSSALMAGDVLLSGVYQLVGGSTFDNATKSAIQEILATSVFELVGGELLDTEAAFIDPDDVRPLAIARYKTAGYSFISPLLIGATAAGASNDNKAALRHFAEDLGVAFQLQDDIISIFGDSAVTGKSTIGDLREGKRTYLIECFDMSATPAQKAFFGRHFGNPELSDTDAETLRELLTSSGARSHVEAKIAELRTEVEAELDAMALKPDHHREFLALIDKSIKRSY